MSARLRFTLEQLRNGTHLLITDVDNVFSRHVPLHGFVKEGYDVYHAYEMYYPTDIYYQLGFVVCSGHQFLRSSPGTIRFLELVVQRCRWSKCDDQVTYNQVFFYDLNVTWDGIDSPNHTEAMRIDSTNAENANLLVESVTGRSPVTNHTIKIWDRDFAWRVSGCAFPRRAANKIYYSSLPTYSTDCNFFGIFPSPTICDVMIVGRIHTRILSFTK
jgi:hypothetical protein